MGVHLSRSRCVLAGADPSHPNQRRGADGSEHAFCAASPREKLTDENIARIADTYHAWRGGKDARKYEDVPGFCKGATLEEVAKHGHVLTPGRDVGGEAQEDDGEPFEEKMKRLTATLRGQQAEAVRLDAAIARNLEELGFVWELCPMNTTPHGPYNKRRVQYGDLLVP